MTSVRVEFRRGEKAEPESLAFDINGSNPGFLIATEKIQNWAVGHVEDRMLDLLDIAGAVLAADASVTRGGGSRTGFGHRWRRRLDFTIEVRDHGFWRRSKVRDLVAETIGFLTDDVVSFHFVQAKAFTARQDYLKFASSGSEDFAGAQVILFSGGLDSLAGAIETLEQSNGRVVLVTHRSAQKIAPHQDRLADALRLRYPGRVAHVPIRAHLKGQRSAERTQRSRSFLFAAFGYVIARIVGADRLDFFENGIVSQNLPLSSMIVGTMATRTTHALAIRKFEELLTVVGGSAFTVANPFEWLTKTEVVQKIGQYGCDDLIADTVSCNHVVDRPKDVTHCGACSQCLDRRFGVLAAGLEASDPDDLYETSVLFGARDENRSKVVALEWTKHSLRLTDVDEFAFLNDFAQSLARLKRGYPTLEPTEVLRRSRRMHVRHGECVKQVLLDAAGRFIEQLLDGDLPPTCLLRVFTADKTGAPKPVAIAARPHLGADEPVRSEDASNEDDQMSVELRRDGALFELVVRGVGRVRGEPAKPAFALYPSYAEDQAAGLPLAERRYTAAKELVPDAGASANAVAQNVKRCRSRLAMFYQAIHGEEPPDDLLIQSKRRGGYRLDPLADVSHVDPAS